MVDRVRRTTSAKQKTLTTKGIVARIIIGVLAVAVVIFGIWLFKHYATWVYLKRLFSPATPAPAYTAIATPGITPAPQAPEDDALQPTAAPEPTPYLHPGERDGKFTEGGVIEGEISYRSRDLCIEIEKVQTDVLTYFVAEVYVRHIDQFFAAFAGGKYGKGTAHTTDMAKENDAVFAVSGDYYNARNTGITIRNGVIYRDKPGSEDILAVFSDGSMQAFDPGERTAEQYLAMGAVHTYAFGPKLVDDGAVFYDEDTDFSFYVHPRCGVGMIEPYHYIFILVDGRKPGYSDGITINDFAKLFASRGCTVAYNLDGGGSATMVFNDELVNLPQGYKRQRGIGDALVIREHTGEPPSEQEQAAK